MTTTYYFQDLGTKGNRAQTRSLPLGYDHEVKWIEHPNYVLLDIPAYVEEMHKRYVQNPTKDMQANLQTSISRPRFYDYVCACYSSSVAIVCLVGFGLCIHDKQWLYMMYSFLIFLYFLFVSLCFILDRKDLLKY